MIRVPVIALLLLLISVCARAESIALHHYTLVAGPIRITHVRDNASGLTFCPKTKSLFMVVDEPELVMELDLEGGVKRTIPLRGFQDVEVFGTEGSLTATRRNVVLTPKGRDAQPITLDAAELPDARSYMVPYLLDCLQNNREPEGMTAMDINVDVVEIIEAARQSVATGAAVALPLP